MDENIEVYVETGDEADAGDIDDVGEIEIDMGMLSEKERSIMLPGEGAGGGVSVFTPRSLMEHTESVHQESEFKLVPKITIADNTAEVFCLRFSPDGKFLAAGCGDGAVRVFSSQTGKLAYNLQGGSNVALPTTCIRFRPITATTRTKNVLIASNAAGSVQHWHMTSGKCLHSTEDENNQVYALDYNSDGSLFATAGKDITLRIYDEATKSLVTAMKGGNDYSIKSTPGHSNRIFAVKFYSEDENIVVSGGWDNTVQLWDVRAGHAVRSIYGPHICGDALDICGNEIVTGSWRTEEQLELWDIRNCQKITEIPWTAGPISGQPACMLYAAQFSKEGAGRFIGAGGSGANEAKVFDHHNGDSVVGIITGLSKGVFATDFSPDNQKFAVAGGDASIRILDIVKRGQ